MPAAAIDRERRADDESGSLEHSQMTISAISSGVPKRPIGSWAMICCAPSGHASSQRSTGGVRTQPGHRGRVNPARETYSNAADLVNPDDAMFRC